MSIHNKPGWRLEDLLYRSGRIRRRPLIDMTTEQIVWTGIKKTGAAFKRAGRAIAGVFRKSSRT